MPNRFDIEVYSADARPVAVVEVKGAPAITSTDASAWRRNLLAHGGLRPDVYFVLVTGSALYVWKPRHRIETLASPPDAIGSTDTLLEPFLAPSGLRSAEDATPGALESLIAAQFNEMARSVGEEQLPAWLTFTGLPAAVRGGEVRTQVPV